MDLQLQDKHVLITGGSKGIGLACAQAFLAEGARVSLVSRSPQNLEKGAAQLRQWLSETTGGAADEANAGGTGAAAPGGPASKESAARVRTFAADLKDPEAAVAALDSAEKAGGPVDVLVNSAGAARRVGPDDLTPKAWRDSMDAKYFTYIHMLDPVVKRMGRRGSGVIVNIIGAGGKVASPTHLSGGAANAALMLVSAGMAAAYGSKGVRVNAVNPGLTLTERLKEGLAAEAKLDNIDIEQALARANKRLPLGRIARPEEIADAVVFLASPRASYITGAILSMDGAVHPMVV
jgi:NAD(P)-dependent dehydrogenase (short-subunit alcohol dehydrogenase family)